jgi:hypothetical protein
MIRRIVDSEPSSGVKREGWAIYTYTSNPAVLPPRSRDIPRRLAASPSRSRPRLGPSERYRPHSREFR